MELKSVWTLVLIFDEHSTMSEKIVERKDSSRVESSLLKINIKKFIPFTFIPQ